MVAIAAKPYDYELPESGGLALLIIDMQRDFLESHGYGAALGNDVTRLQKIVPTVRILLNTFRACQLPVLQTMECHEPDLSDCPPSKLKRGQGSLRIGDETSMGRLLIKGEPGNAIISDLQPLPGEPIITKPG